MFVCYKPLKPTCFLFVSFPRYQQKTAKGQEVYLNCSLIVWAVEESDFDGDSLGSLGGFLGGFGGFAGGLVWAIIHIPLVLGNLQERENPPCK